MELLLEQANALSRGGAISVNSIAMHRANVNVVLDEKNAKRYIMHIIKVELLN